MFEDHRARTFADLVDCGLLLVGDGYRAKLDELGGGGGPYFLRAGALSDRGFDWSGLDAFEADRGGSLEVKVGEPRDVVLTTKGNSIGRVGWVPDDAPVFAYSPHLSFWRSLDAGELVPRFLYYWARSEAFTRQLRTLAYGTDMAPYFSLRDQAKLRIALPHPAEQCAIAEVLGALDDKIAANERVVTLLDEMVRAEFDELPGESRALSDVADNIRAQVAPRSLAGDLTYLGLEHLPRRRMWAGDSGYAANVTSAKSRFAARDVLFGKLRPYFHKVVAASEGGICSTDILVVRARDPRLAGFVLAATASDGAVRRTSAATEGTRMPRTNWKDLGAVPIPWPGEAAVLDLSERVTQMSGAAVALCSENRALARTRDELLPLLMSGKLRVRDVERTLDPTT